MKTVKTICALIAAVLLCGCQTLPGNSPGASAVTGGTVTGGGVPDAELTAKDYSSLVGVDALGRVFNAAGAKGTENMWAAFTGCGRDSIR